MTDTYDSLNRLGTATAKNLSGTTLWSQTFTYDRYGNMSCSGSGLCTMMSYDTSKNRISLIATTQTPSYDAAGNLTSDGTGTGTYSYTWNAEGRLATATAPSGGTSTTSFIYNALGERVQLVAPTYTYNYPFDAFGKEIGIHNSSTGWGHYTVEMAGRRIFLSGSATRWLFHPNALGSSTMVTDQTGAVVQDATYYPWGQLWQSPGSFGGNWNFAAFGVLEPTTNLYPTPTRRYAVSYSRWLTPDPGGEKVVTLADPQTWNMYSYVRDTPLTRNDPSGLIALSGYNVAGNEEDIVESVNTFWTRGLLGPTPADDGTDDGQSKSQGNKTPEEQASAQNESQTKQLSADDVSNGVKAYDSDKSDKGAARVVKALDTMGKDFTATGDVVRAGV